MVVVSRGVKACRIVTLHANGIARGAQFPAVGLMTITTTYARRVHPALQERGIVIHLVALLSVGIVQTGFEQRWPEIIKERVSGPVVIAVVRCVLPFRCRWISRLSADVHPAQRSGRSWPVRGVAIDLPSQYAPALARGRLRSQR